VTEPVTSTPPVVSVVSITYNHEPFIRETLDGFVSQQVDFPIEIIVADDASTDATQAIIQSYADRHPGLFRPILRSENVGIHANLTGALAAARGEYLALCEGDDYWTDPQKLAKQVSCLEQHPGVGLCFHPVRVTWSDDSVADSEYPPAKWRRRLTVDELFHRNFIQTNSVMYRRLPRYDDIPADIMPLDWYLHVRHALQGSEATVPMLTDKMAVYRRHPQGAWYSADTDRDKFWRAHGRGHGALLDALLGLCAGKRRRQVHVLGTAHWILGQLASVPGPEGRALMLDIVAQRPRLFKRNPAQRLFVMAMLQYQRTQTAQRRVRSALRRPRTPDGSSNP
jgi:glycosyltransferase involved in cell wall biosynthesis